MFGYSRDAIFYFFPVQLHGYVSGHSCIDCSVGLCGGREVPALPSIFWYKHVYLKILLGPEWPWQVCCCFEVADLLRSVVPALTGKQAA